MKKTIFTITVLCVFGLYTNTSFGGDLNKGVIAGWQYSDLLNDGESLFGDHYNSFFVGFFNNKKLGSSKLLQLNSALMYFQNGSRHDDDNKLRMHYLNIPVSLKVQVGPIYGFAGINGGIKLGGEMYLLGIKGDVKDFNLWDAGIQAGIGAKISIVGIEAKYNWGIVDVYEGYKSQYLQLGILLYIGKNNK